MTIAAKRDILNTMVKLHKKKNPHMKRLSVLFVVQVVLGVVPAALFMIYVVYVQRLERLEEYDVRLGIIFISIMLFSFAGYIGIARRYNILLSGVRGEKVLERTARKFDGDYTIFTNLPIRYKHNRSELDLVIIGEQGVLVVETKNHSGVIIGADSDETWVHRKYYRKGKIVENEMKNPFKQIKRQREILKSILRANGLDIWIDSILFFSGNPSLRLRSDGEIAVAASENELTALVAEYRSKRPPTTEEVEKIVEIFREHTVL